MRRPKRPVSRASDFPHGEFALSQQVAPYTIPEEPHPWRSVMLSLMVHLLLLAFLWVGVSWQSLTPTTVEAEIWDAVQRDAAPPPPEPEPLQESPKPEPEPPKPEPEPKPPKPVPVPKAPVVVPEPPKVKPVDPDIALEQEKKRKQQKEKEKLAEEKRQREEQERKQIAEEEKRQKEEQALKDQKKLEEEQKRKQEAADAEEKKRKLEAAAAEERRRKEAAAAEKQKARSAVADALSQAGDGEEGSAEKKSGAPGTVCELYIGKTVKSNISFPSMPGDPVVTIGIRLTPSRMLKEVKVVKPSEYPEFDKQVERGIRKSGQFPRECPEEFNYLHYLKPR